MQLFRDAVDTCGFMDLGYLGTKFTWSKHSQMGNRYGRDLIELFALTNGYKNLQVQRLYI